MSKAPQHTAEPIADRASDKPTPAPVKQKAPPFEFTPAHRAAADSAFAAGKVVVIDRGPAPPVSEKVEGERTPAEIEAENTRMILAKREYDEWHKANPEPIAVRMDQIDANHSVQSDPVRYVLVPRGVRAPVTLEERVALIERRLGPETPEEIKHRQERDAAYRDNAAKAPK